jgi:hypothetical protein
MTPVITLLPRLGYKNLDARPHRQGGAMAKRDDDREPLGQRLLDRPFLLLAGGLVVMFGFYTVWGLLEIASLPPARLP